MIITKLKFFLTEKDGVLSIDSTPLFYTDDPNFVRWIEADEEIESLHPPFPKFPAFPEISALDTKGNFF